MNKLWAVRIGNEYIAMYDHDQALRVAATGRAAGIPAVVTAWPRSAEAHAADLVGIPEEDDDSTDA